MVDGSWTNSITVLPPLLLVLWLAITRYSGISHLSLYLKPLHPSIPPSYQSVHTYLAKPDTVCWAQLPSQQTLRGKNTMGRRAAALCKTRVARVWHVFTSQGKSSEDTFFLTPSSEEHLLLRAAGKSQELTTTKCHGQHEGLTHARNTCFHQLF